MRKKVDLLLDKKFENSTIFYKNSMDLGSINTMKNNNHASPEVEVEVEEDEIMAASPRNWWERSAISNDDVLTEQLICDKNHFYW